MEVIAMYYLNPWS